VTQAPQSVTKAAAPKNTAPVPATPQTAAPVTKATDPVAKTTPATTIQKTTAPVATTVQKTTAPVATTVQKTTAPVTTTLQKTTAPVTTTVQKTTAPVATTVANAAAPVTHAVQTIANAAAPVTTTLQQATAPITTVTRTVTQATAPVTDTLAAATLQAATEAVPLGKLANVVTRLAGSAVTASMSPVVQLVAPAAPVSSPVAHALALLSGTTPTPPSGDHSGASQAAATAGRTPLDGRSTPQAGGTNGPSGTAMQSSIPARTVTDRALGNSRLTTTPLPLTTQLTPSPADTVTPAPADAPPSPALAHRPGGAGAVGPLADADVPPTAPVPSLVWPSWAAVTPHLLPAASPLAATTALTRTPGSKLLSAPPLPPVPAAPLVSAPALGGTGIGAGSSGFFFFFFAAAALLELLALVVPRLTGRLRIMSEVGRPAPFIALLAEPG
jgi:hypothetical protein